METQLRSRILPFTLVEILVVMTLLVTLFGMTVTYSRILAPANFEKNKQVIEGMTHQARRIANYSNSPVSIIFERADKKVSAWVVASKLPHNSRKIKRLLGKKELLESVSEVQTSVTQMPQPRVEIVCTPFGHWHAAGAESQEIASLVLIPTQHRQGSSATISLDREQPELVDATAFYPKEVMR